ncbi:uncharacterized protein LOC131875721 [Cryptomeria japonica]|uniref:uncharacterized protein LOC131875721 n=1 Tax=Cryptomeria japonica TaxID=3369 RepID=UPI0027DAB192|nr:uncharacterized protein LOC131875721 [Cryptomeria japonica]
MEMQEWELLSRMGITSHNDIDKNEMLGRREFDHNYKWDEITVPNDLHDMALEFIAMAKNHCLNEPIPFVDKGTTGIGKSYLINCIRNELEGDTPYRHQILALAPTGIAAFNINATPIHSALKIPIKDMHPLQGQALTVLQEDMKYVRYILIDEMSFIGPKLLLRIDMRLHEAFPNRQHLPFGGISIILIGDFAQLPPDDWELLMTRTSKELTPIQNEEFNKLIHPFATNNMVRSHNKKVLQKLNRPVAISEAANVRSRQNVDFEDEQLEKKILLCKGQQIMLTTNIWTKSGLVNGALGEVVDIVYEYGFKPRDIPTYVITRINNYIGPSWNPTYPKVVPITPISLGNRRQIPLKMAWAITVHKSQGLTLQKATIDIGATERQGLTFTPISRVKTLDCLRIEPRFSFERYCKMQNNPYTIIRKQEEARLQQRSLQNKIKVICQNYRIISL